MNGRSAVEDVSMIDSIFARSSVIRSSAVPRPSRDSGCTARSLVPADLDQDLPVLIPVELQDHDPLPLAEQELALADGDVLRGLASDEMTEMRVSVLGLSGMQVLGADVEVVVLVRILL